MANLDSKLVIRGSAEGGLRALRSMRDGVASVSTQLSRLQTLAGVALGAQGLRGLAAQIDGYASLSARLKLTTESQQEFNTAQRELFGVARRNQIDIGALTTLYTRLAPAVRQLGGAQAETLRITEAVALSLRVSGATAAESASAILQFTQALGAGALRGEEFNAIAEAAPRLMQALADGLGRPRGELKKLAEQGKLTADVVGNALIQQLAALQREAAQMPRTIGGAFQNLRNEFQRLLGASADVSTLSAAVVQAVDAMSRHLDILAAAAIVLGAAFAGLKLGSARLATALTGLAATIAGPAGIVVALIALAAAWLGVKRAQEEANEQSATFVQAEIDGLRKLQAERAARNRGFVNDRDRDVARRIIELQGKLDEANAKAIADAERKREENRFRAFAPGASLRSPLPPPVPDRVAQAKASFDRELALQRDAIERERKLNDERHQLLLIDAQTYFDARARLETRALDIERRALERELAQRRAVLDENRKRLAALGPTEADKREQFGEQIKTQESELAELQARIAIIARDRADSERRIADERTRALSASREELAVLERQLAQRRGTTESIDDIRARIDSDFAEQRNREFLATGDTRRTDALIAQAVAQERLNQLTREYQALLERRAVREEALRQSLERGDISQDEFTARVQALRDAAAPAMTALVDGMAAIADTVGPAAAAQVARLRTEIAGLRAPMSEFERATRAAGQGALAGFFNDLADGAKTAGQAFRDMLQGFLKEIQRFLVQKAVQQLIQLIAKFFTSDTSTSIGTGTGRHGGGVIGRDEPTFRRTIDPRIFAFAQRLHRGGIAGLRDNEVPTILEEGEEVITRRDPRHRDSGGRAGGVNVNVSVNGAQGTAADQRRAGVELAAIVEGVVSHWALRQSRPGGLLFRGA